MYSTLCVSLGMELGVAPTGHLGDRDLEASDPFLHRSSEAQLSLLIRCALSLCEDSVAVPTSFRAGEDLLRRGHGDGENPPKATHAGTGD